MAGSAIAGSAGSTENDREVTKSLAHSHSLRVAGVPVSPGASPRVGEVLKEWKDTRISWRFSKKTFRLRRSSSTPTLRVPTPAHDASLASTPRAPGPHASSSFDIAGADRDYGGYRFADWEAADVAAESPTERRHLRIAKSSSPLSLSPKAPARKALLLAHSPSTPQPHRRAAKVAPLELLPPPAAAAAAARLLTPLVAGAALAARSHEGVARDEVLADLEHLLLGSETPRGAATAAAGSVRDPPRARDVRTDAVDDLQPDSSSSERLSPVLSQPHLPPPEEQSQTLAEPSPPGSRRGDDDSSASASSRPGSPRSPRSPPSGLSPPLSPRRPQRQRRPVDNEYLTCSSNGPAYFRRVKPSGALVGAYLNFAAINAGERLYTPPKKIFMPLQSSGSKEPPA